MYAQIGLSVFWRQLLPNVYTSPARAFKAIAIKKPAMHRAKAGFCAVDRFNSDIDLCEVLVSKVPVNQIPERT